jgi:hypothetical protein
MRDHHHIDGIAVDAGRGEIRNQLPDDSVALFEIGVARAGIADDELAAAPCSPRPI